MKKKDLLDLRKKEEKELEKTLSGKRKELSKARIDMKVGKEKNLKKAKKLSHEVSQILTILKEKKILEKEKK